MRRVFIDTWGWISYQYRDQPRHDDVRELINELLVNSAAEIYTSAATMAETLNINSRQAKLRAARGRRHPLDLLAEMLNEWIKNESLEFLIEDLDDTQSALGRFRKHIDNPISYVDCMNYTLMRREGIREIVTGDGDYLVLDSSLVLQPTKR